MKNIITKTPARVLQPAAFVVIIVGVFFLQQLSGSVSEKV